MFLLPHTGISGSRTPETRDIYCLLFLEQVKVPVQHDLPASMYVLDAELRRNSTEIGVGEELVRSRPALPWQVRRRPILLITCAAGHAKLAELHSKQQGVDVFHALRQLRIASYRLSHT